MASREDLVRIGKEGFDIIDQLYNNKGRNAGAAAARKPPTFPKGGQVYVQYQPQQRHVYKENSNER